MFGPLADSSVDRVNRRAGCRQINRLQGQVERKVVTADQAACNLDTRPSGREWLDLGLSTADEA